MILKSRTRRGGRNVDVLRYDQANDVLSTGARVLHFPMALGRARAFLTDVERVLIRAVVVHGSLAFPRMKSRDGRRLNRPPAIVRHVEPDFNDVDGLFVVVT